MLPPHPDPVTAAVAMRRGNQTKSNKTAIQGRGHVIGRWNDRRIDIGTQYIDLRIVSPNGEKPGCTGHEDYQTQLLRENSTLENLDHLVSGSEYGDFIILRGRAGVGKTTALYKVLYEWAGDQWGQQFDIALMFSARQMSMMNQGTNSQGITLKEFLETCSLHKVRLKGTQLQSNDIEEEHEMLVCVDGVDEFQFFHNRFRDNLQLTATSTLEPYQWCISILKREVLKHSTLIITSRHFDGLKLLKPKKTMDVVGLTKDNIKEYIQRHVSEQNKERVENIIFSNHIMLSVSTITFFCMMLCRALEDARGKLHVGPDLSSYTRITAFIFKDLYERNSGANEKLPEATIKSCLRKLAKLAYLGLVTKSNGTGIPQLIYSNEDLNECELTTQDVEAGINLGLVIKYKTEHSVNTEFIHLLVQEVLAMVHLLGEKDITAKSTFEKMWNSKAFSTALSHLFGLRYDSYHLVRDLVEKVGDAEQPLDISGLLYGVLREKKPDRYQRLCAIQMAYESYNPKIASTVVGLMYHDSDIMEFSDMHLTAVDLNGIFFAVNCTDNIRKLRLMRIRDINICLEDIENSMAKDMKIEEIVIDGTAISKMGLNHLLTSLTKKTKKIHTLGLNSAAIDDSLLEILANFLKDDKYIKKLSLKQNVLSQVGIKVLVDALKNNQSLTTVVFDQAMDEATIQVLNTLQQINPKVKVEYD